MFFLIFKFSNYIFFIKTKQFSIMLIKKPLSHSLLNKLFKREKKYKIIDIHLLLFKKL